MFPFIRFIYSAVLLPVLFTIFNLLGLFNSKIRQALKERYLIYSKIEKWIPVRSDKKKTVLIHAASMGEFEHIKPILLELKNNFDVSVVLTFFSPSGYNHINEFPGIDLILYNPFDFACLWKKFYSMLQPDLLIISKHDAWPNQTWTARDKKIPVYLINASLAESSSRIRPLARWFFGYVYETFDQIYASSEEDVQRFKKYYPNCKVRYIGDTKFDQVLVRKEMALTRKRIPDEWLENKTTLLFGSIWKEDAQHIFPALLKLISQLDDIRIIIVPHQPSSNFLEDIINFFGEAKCQKYTMKDELQTEPVLIVDIVGILAELYKYAQIAYVGGSFKQGIHNVMEAAVYGIPVLYGPQYQNSTEAIKLLSTGGSHITSTREEFLSILTQLLDDPVLRQRVGERALNYAMSNLGATRKLLAEWSKHLN